jgi:hypothetical protein
MESPPVLIHFHEAREIADVAFAPERLPYSRAVVYVRLVFGNSTNERGIHLSPVPNDEIMHKELTVVVNHHLRRTLPWLRRFGLLEVRTDSDSDPIPDPILAPLATTLKTKIEEIGFNKLARYSQYLTEVKDVALVLDIAYGMYRAVPRTIEPNPIKSVVEWKKHWLGRDLLDMPAMDKVKRPEETFVSLREVLAFTKKSEKGTDTTTSAILATIMRAGACEFQPRRRILAWKTQDEEEKLGKGLSIFAGPTIQDPLPWLVEYVVPALEGDHLAALLFVTLCGLEMGQGVVEHLIGGIADFKTNYSDYTVSTAWDIAVKTITTRHLPER